MKRFPRDGTDLPLWLGIHDKGSQVSLSMFDVINQQASPHARLKLELFVHKEL
jgi:hypothetical protein